MLFKMSMKIFVKYLIELGVDINKQSSDDKTPLFGAFFSGNLNLVKYLVDRGFDIDKVKDDGWTPLFLRLYEWTQRNSKIFG